MILRFITTSTGLSSPNLKVRQPSSPQAIFSRRKPHFSFDRGLLEGQNRAQNGPREGICHELGLVVVPARGFEPRFPP